MANIVTSLDPAPVGFVRSHDAATQPAGRLPAGCRTPLPPSVAAIIPIEFEATPQTQSKTSLASDGSVARPTVVADVEFVAPEDLGSSHGNTDSAAAGGSTSVLSGSERPMRGKLATQSGPCT